MIKIKLNKTTLFINYNYVDIPVNIDVPRFQIINTSQSNDIPRNENATNTSGNNGEEADDRSEVNTGRNTNENQNGNIQSVSDIIIKVIEILVAL